MKEVKQSCILKCSAHVKCSVNREADLERIIITKFFGIIKTQGLQKKKI